MKYYFSKVIWLVIDYFGYQFINLIIQILLARILMPEDFGKISLIIIFVAIFSTIFEQGYLNSLLINKNIKDIDLNTIFWFSLLLGLFCYSVIFIISSPIANFYKIPELESAMKILGISVIFNSALVVFKYELIKGLYYRKQATITLVSGLTSGIIAIVLAINGFNLWSLVAKTLIMNVLVLILMVSTSNWRPMVVFSFEILKKHLKTGTNIMIVGILETLYSYSLNLIIGRYYGVRELGFYTNAQKFTQIIANVFILVSKKLSLSIFPQFDEIKKRSVINKLITFSNAMLLPVIIIIYLNSEIIITTLLGKQWIQATPYFEVFIFIAYLNILIKQYLTLTELLNKTNILVRLETAFKIIAIGFSILLIISNVNLLWVLISLLLINLFYLVIYLLMYIDKYSLVFSAVFIFISIVPIMLIKNDSFIFKDIWLVQIIYLLIVYIINTILLYIYNKKYEV